MPKPLTRAEILDHARQAGTSGLAHKQAIDLTLAASYLGVSVKTLRRRIADGKPARIPGRA